MNHLDSIAAELEKKLKRRDKRKRPAMKVSGSGVKKLQRLIIKKGRRT